MKNGWESHASYKCSSVILCHYILNVTSPTREVPAPVFLLDRVPSDCRPDTTTGAAGLMKRRIFHPNSARFTGSTRTVKVTRVNIPTNLEPPARPAISPHFPLTEAKPRSGAHVVELGDESAQFDTAIRRTDRPRKVGYCRSRGRGRGCYPGSLSRRCNGTSNNTLVHHTTSRRRLTSLSADRSTGFYEGAVVPPFPTLRPLAIELFGSICQRRK